MLLVIKMTAARNKIKLNRLIEPLTEHHDKLGKQLRWIKMDQKPLRQKRLVLILLLYSITSTTYVLNIL